MVKMAFDIITENPEIKHVPYQGIHPPCINMDVKSVGILAIGASKKRSH
jgi:hypothetical protein